MRAFLIIGAAGLVATTVAWVAVQLVGRAITRRLDDPALRDHGVKIGTNRRGDAAQGPYDFDKAVAAKKQAEERIKAARALHAAVGPPVTRGPAVVSALRPRNVK